ncbi:RNA-binding protein, putative [Bodo saltans]|uniref:RNA-binding protein, putative n=1 Tax=Bodo saltans TaxID=75058 RepID=A0A0S4KR70_BODSA|nr:RNA-binding protein, putative [Bodo saltans]|eukprot:CUI15474.1 RNA-binding protein, putative [Bodo saltans]
MSDGLKSVFFSGVPLGVSERDIRKMFSQAGHVVGFRIMPLIPGKEFMSGFVDYVDGRSADEAISQLDGHLFGETKMKVTNAASRKRARQPAGGDASAGPLLEFKKGFQNLFLPGDQRIEGALRQLPISDAYEAVEQLRILVLERPEDARALLEANPQLAVAVVMILQHAGKLPIDHLPEDAVVRAGSVSATASTTAATSASSASGDQPTADVIAQVMAIIEGMDPEDVEQISKMTPEQLAAIPDEAARKQLEFLQRQLKLMDSM